MAVSAVITPGKIFGSTEVVTISELNKLGNPTVDISGAVGSLSLSDGSVTNAKVAAGTGVQLDKLETGSDAQVIVANSSGEGVWKTVSGDATVDNLGAVTIAAGAVTQAMLNSDVIFMPAGAITQYGAASAPTGWLLCDGAAKNAAADTTLQALFDVIGNTYGGSDNTDFQVPNLKGKVPVGLDAAQTEFDALAETGGANTHTLTEAEMPSHTHTIHGEGDYAASTNIQFGGGTSSVQGDIVSSSTGGGGSHNNLQPYLVVNFIIKT